MLDRAAWERFLCEAERLGLPLVAALSLEREKALFAAEPPPAGATHALVVMQAGGAFWEHLRAVRSLDPTLDAHSDPLDTFTLRMAARLAGLLGGATLETRHPSTSKLDFIALGETAGLGGRSRLAMLIHPTYGLWTAFRLLFLVKDPEGVLPPAPAPVEAACTGCAAPCIGACPAGAIAGPRGQERLDFMASYAYRRAHAGICADACAARLACPVGIAHRYPAAFIADSHHRAWRAGLALLSPAPAPTGPTQRALF